ncbi:hypothetical protein MUK42_06509 [Musa troglodytarum]|uniref:Uncharacterized protein n=1 Tax=Musa troglodytarum TaxID=320322 RepID=A0A9E7EQC4_9LILI|nr:hypothetical protein MUK42_06509 [Musa troglodytarum]
MDTVTTGTHVHGLSAAYIRPATASLTSPTHPSFPSSPVWFPSSRSTQQWIPLHPSCCGHNRMKAAATWIRTSSASPSSRRASLTSGSKYGANQDGVASAGSLQDRLLVCQGERRRLQGLTSKAPPSPPSPTSGFQDPRDERVNDASRGIIDRLQLCNDERRQLQEQDLSKAEAKACKKPVLDYTKINQERKHPSAKARKVLIPTHDIHSFD